MTVTTVDLYSACGLAGWSGRAAGRAQCRVDSATSVEGFETNGDLGLFGNYTAVFVPFGPDGQAP